MQQTTLLIIVISAVGILLFLVLKLKLNAFISLLMVSMFVGVATGMPPREIINSMQNGMGSILGFVAVIVGLGAIFGQMLESSGGAHSLARYLIRKFGVGKAQWALMLAGFIIAIPVFFDVGFIILVPIVYAISKQTKLSTLHYAIPLLAGLAVTHSFIPPTPGPVAVAEIIQAELGWVILFGFIVGLPTAIIAGPYFGRYIGEKLFIAVPDYLEAEIDQGEDTDKNTMPGFWQIASLIALPLFLILVSTVLDVLVKQDVIMENFIVDLCWFLGHPFVALIIATVLALYFLGIKRGFTKDQLLQLSGKALGPAGLIILVTGAGGVFKQILVDSGIGEMLARSMTGAGIAPIILAYLIAAIIRVTQGSATVAMITAAGFISPVLELFELSGPGRALIVLSIAAGATILSHVNDSGFWLIGKYLGMTEKQTLQSWTVMETIISVVAFGIILVLSWLV